MILDIFIIIIAIVPALKDWIAHLAKRERRQAYSEISSMFPVYFHDKGNGSETATRFPVPCQLQWVFSSCLKISEVLASLGGEQHQYQLAVFFMGMGSVDTRFYGTNLPFLEWMIKCQVWQRRRSNHFWRMGLIWKEDEMRQGEVSGTRNFVSRCAKDKARWSIWVAVSRPACLEKGLMLKISSTNMVNRNAELVTQHQISCPIVPINFPICTGPCAWIWSSENVDTIKSLVPSSLPSSYSKAVPHRSCSWRPSFGVPSMTATQSLSLYVPVTKSLQMVSIRNRWRCSPKQLRFSTNAHMDKKSWKMKNEESTYQKCHVYLVQALGWISKRNSWKPQIRMGRFEKLLCKTS